MKCPYCGTEMAAGYLYNGSQPLQWLPNSVMPARIKFTKKDEGITLQNKFKFFRESGYRADAFCCGNCHIVIAPTE